MYTQYCILFEMGQMKSCLKGSSGAWYVEEEPIKISLALADVKRFRDLCELWESRIRSWGQAIRHC